MTFENLVIQFLIWGKPIKPLETQNFKKYLSTMLKRDRVLLIESDMGMECLLCYFLTDTLEPFANRPMWSCPEDNFNGHIFFVDKMISSRWTPTLRRLVRDQVEERFPQVDQAFWLREPNNRNVIIKKRGRYVHG